ncbi:MAG: vanadium-dependent haloperoxidase, partial [Chloroflexi bacterium]|nr:vanadium-dependent haloperoxidase [Chloroflexota bacterium]
IDLFPTERPLFDALMAQLGYDPANTSADATPAGVGNLCARAVLTFRHGDRSNQLGDLHWPPYSDWTGYQPVNPPEPAAVVDPNHWQPLRVSDGSGGYVTQTYVGPHWGLVTPFALTAGDQLRPPGPQTTPFGPGTSPAAGYVAQADQILGYSAGLTDTQKVMAEYWKDGPRSEQPPGHWCLFAQFVSARDRHDLDDDVVLFFALTNALLDAGIAAWDAKRAYDSVRPVTAIHWLYGGQPVTAWGGPCQGTQRIPGTSWDPYQPATIVTPPFPEYISGHSTFSAAAAEVLRRFTGGDRLGAAVTVPAHSSSVEPCTPATPVTLSWATFSQAAAQAGMSRRYGGIHFEEGALMGRAVGRRVGALAWDRARAFISGREASTAVRSTAGEPRRPERCAVPGPSRRLAGAPRLPAPCSGGYSGPRGRTPDRP